jgi:antitoxin (DNA-binding transcriptional repressor) of toxin-antitoxin stability system
MTYSVQDAHEHFREILQKARSGERIVIIEEGREVVEIMGLPPKPDSMEAGYRQLVEEGGIVPSAGPRGELAPIVDAPGTLARFLESRD